MAPSWATTLLLLALPWTSFGQNSLTTGKPPKSALYRQKNAPMEARIQDLLKRMTIQEKMGQTMQGYLGNWLSATDGSFNKTGLVAEMSYKTGQFYVGMPIPWDWLADGILKAQKYLVEETRLGIPALVQTEGIHGFLIGNATIFPSPIAYGCAWDPEMVHEMGRIIGQESMAFGANHLFAPVMDLAREYRFGRVEEMFGEDTYHAGIIGEAYVKGLQSTKVSATVKHFIGFGTPEQGCNTCPVHGGEREMRRTYMPAFHRAIIGGDAWSIMSAYHSYDGVPAAADHHFLTDVLRGEWGYKYHVTTDAGGSDKLCNDHGICARGDWGATTMHALVAGNDVEMGGGSFNYRAIPDLVKNGTLDIQILDTAIERILRTKFKMGLFDNPYQAAPKSKWDSLVHTKYNRDFARKLDAEGIVLMENNKNILPLDKNKINKIAVVGPMAHGFMNYGDYVVYQSQYRGVTPLDGITNVVGKDKVIYAKGVERWSNDESGFQEAIDAAKAADVAVIVVGTWSRDQQELWQGLNATTGEHVDVHNLDLVGGQAKLAQAIIDLGKPTILVVQAGKPVTEQELFKTAGAFLCQYYPGEEGGNALADVIFGAHNPSGRLSTSWPRDIGTAPSYYDYLKGSRWVDAGFTFPNGTIHFGHDYVLESTLPLYPFGFGRSYTTFAWQNVTLDKAQVGKSGTVTASVSVKNTGTVAGTEVVQLYVTDKIASVVTPNMELRGFQKLRLNPGETKTARISIPVSELAVWNIQHQTVVEPGEFLVQVGNHSLSISSSKSFWVS